MTVRHRWNFDDVLARTDLRSLLDEVTSSNGRHGPTAKWHCPTPEHADRRPSVTVSADHHGKDRWRCWSNSDHRGDAIDLVRVVRGVDVADAVDWLASRARMVPDKPLPPALPRKVPSRQTRLSLDPIVHRYVATTHAVLRSPQGEPMRGWLGDRGIGTDVIVANRLGADVGRDLMRRRRGLPYGAGPGVVFPAYSHNGALAYVQTRYLDPDVAGRKYDNPASALGVNPRVAFIKTPASTPGRPPFVLVTEGIPDGLIAAQAGFAVVSVMGSQAPDAVSITRIANYAEDLGSSVAVVVDADTAGSQAVEAISQHLTEAGASTTIVDLPDGLDLNDWALQHKGWADELADGLSDPSPGPVPEFEAEARREL